jgi:uncharacterized protein
LIALLAFKSKFSTWSVRKRDEGSTAFDDTIGEVSGIWVLGCSAQREAGYLISIMVDNAEATVRKIQTEGCEIVKPIGADYPEITARFRDPAGNLLGIYQEPTSYKEASQAAL